jgi:hypothetical protein
LSGFQEIKIPTIYKALLEYYPYLVLYGGRNAGKDFNLVRTDLAKAMLYSPKYTAAEIDGILDGLCGSSLDRTLLRRCLKAPCRMLYCREVMQSIKRSSYQTIKDTIIDIGLSGWEFRDDKIVYKNGSEFFFAGLYRDPHNVKSIEGVTDCRVVEAQNVTEESWKNLVPTIRKELATFVVSFNTCYTDDPTYERWVSHPPKGAKVIKVNSTDIENYLTETAKRNREEDYRLRRWEYDNVWKGEPLAAGSKLYPGFNEEVHCREFDWKWIKSRSNFFMACDPASNHYPACLWAAVLRDDTGEMIKYIYREYPQFDDFGDYFHKIRKSVVFTGTIADLADAFTMGDGFSPADIRAGLNIRKRFIDSRFARGSGQGNFLNKTGGIVMEFAKAGIDFDEPELAIIDVQKELITADLAYNPNNPIGAMNHPHIYIHPSCINLINSLKNHRLEEKSSREMERHKDFCDCAKILYAGIAENPFKDPLNTAPEYKKPKIQLYEKVDSWMGA